MAPTKNQLVQVEPVKVVEAELVESLPPELSLPAGLPPMEAEINRLVDLRVAKIIARRDDFQPYFQSRRVAQELKRIQSVPEQRLWSIYYERWGCTHCDKKTRPHSSCGMCGPCRFKIGYRRKEIQREQSGEKEHPVPRVCEDCGRRFPPLTDARWEHIRQKHESSMRHKRKARSCVICRKDFRPMSGPQWEYLRREHERGESHRRAMREREAK